MRNEQKFISECILAFLGNRNYKKLKKLYKLINVKILNILIVNYGIAGYFYRLYLDKVFNTIDIPDGTIQLWKKISGRNLLINEINDKEALKIVNSLTTNNIDYIYIKGLSLRRRCYRDNYINISTDIDLFIKKSDYIKVKKILLDSSYEIPLDYYINKIAIEIPFEEFEKYAGEICFIKKQDSFKFIVDLQWDFIFGSDKTSIFHKIYRFESFYQFKNTNKIDIEENKIKVFPLETEFINMSFHFAFHHGFCGIKWLTDICMFVKKYETEIDFNTIRKTVDSNLIKILGIILMFAYEFNSKIKMSKEQRKLFCVDRLIPFEYTFYKSMVFKPYDITSNRRLRRAIKILLPYSMQDRFLVIKNYLKFWVKNYLK
jgi:hypothetical protein